MHILSSVLTILTIVSIGSYLFLTLFLWSIEYIDDYTLVEFLHLQFNAVLQWFRRIY